MHNGFFYFILIILRMQIIEAYAGKYFTLDLNSKTGNGTLLGQIGCQLTDIININFQGHTTWICQSSATCTIGDRSPKTSLQLKYLTQIIENYQLNNIYLTSYLFVSKSTYSIILEFIGGIDLHNDFVYFIVPINNNPQNLTAPNVISLDYIKPYPGNADGYTQLRYFYTLKHILEQGFETNVPRSIFSTFQFLNSRDFARFYTIRDDRKVYLISKYIYKVISGSFLYNLAQNMPGVTSSVTYDQSTKICFGSFQIIVSELDDNEVLWVNFFVIILYTIYIIFPRSTTDTIYAEKFQQNRFTCWPLYSLYFLEHTKYYTKTSRSMPYLLNFAIQSMVLSILYLKLGTVYRQTMIGWAGVIAFACTIWLPFAFGCIFLKNIQRLGIESMQFQYSILSRFKEDARTRQGRLRLVQIDENIDSYYYWMYAFSLILFITSSALSVYFSMKYPVGYNFLNYYWMASISISFVLDFFIFEGLGALLLGGTALYRMKGFYFDSSMGTIQRKLHNMEELILSTV